MSTSSPSPGELRLHNRWVFHFTDRSNGKVRSSFFRNDRFFVCVLILQVRRIGSFDTVQVLRLRILFHHLFQGILETLEWNRSNNVTIQHVT